jgi:hypothetical protein
MSDCSMRRDRFLRQLDYFDWCIPRNFEIERPSDLMLDEAQVLPCIRGCCRRMDGIIIQVRKSVLFYALSERTFLVPNGILRN